MWTGSKKCPPKIAFTKEIWSYMKIALFSIKMSPSYQCGLGVKNALPLKLLMKLGKALLLFFNSIEKKCHIIGVFQKSVLMFLLSNKKIPPTRLQGTNFLGQRV
uniref:Uncharacterized protein n=1 Tax=Cacopsylla melanoneura TaxID=428564 RepID=A0A8D9EA84_9HEMI